MHRRCRCSCRYIYILLFVWVVLFVSGLKISRVLGVHMCCREFLEVLMAFGDVREFKYPALECFNSRGVPSSGKCDVLTVTVPDVVFRKAL